MLLAYQPPPPGETTTADTRECSSICVYVFDVSIMRSLDACKGRCGCSWRTSGHCLYGKKGRERERERECRPSEGSDLGAGCGGGREDASQNDLWDSLACVCVQESIVYV